MSVLYTYKTRLSKGIAGMYIIILVLILIAYSAIALLVRQDNDSSEFAWLVIILMIFMVAMFGFIIYKAYAMRFEITEDSLIIHGIFKKHVVTLTAIEQAHRSPVPFGFRLFGASLLGGFYYFPGIGTAWVAMGNFKDGVLIKTLAGKHFFITPERPDSFLSHLKS